MMCSTEIFRLEGFCSPLGFACCCVLVLGRIMLCIAAGAAATRCPGRLSRDPVGTPCNKVASPSRPFHANLARRGYIVALWDCRGRFNSDRVFDLYRREHADGFDTIEWLAAQEWCSDWMSCNEQSRARAPYVERRGFWPYATGVWRQTFGPYTTTNDL
jgi:hypothetical protein